MSNDFGEIEEKRRQLGLSQEEVATQLGISRQHYNAIVNNKNTPSVELAKQLGGLLGFRWTIFFENTVNK